MTEAVLLVDDEANVLSGYKRQLRKRFNLETAQGGAAALRVLEEKGPFAVIVSDMMMPEMNGLQLLSEVMTRAPTTVRMMLTGNADQKTAMDAVNEGSVYRFLTKPIETEDLARALEDGLGHHRLITAEKELLEQTLAGSVKVLVDLLSIVDQQAFGRGTTLRAWSRPMARKLKLPQPWTIELAAMLARIGEVTLPAELRGAQSGGREPSPLEREMIARVPQISRDLIANIPRMKPIADIVLHQNKRYDGGGFPEAGGTGAEIPAGARLLKILGDLYEFCAGTQVTDAAFVALARDAGAYDPKLLDAVRRNQDLLILRQSEGGGDAVVESPVISLQPGDRLATDLTSQSGDLVLAKGHELTAPLIEKLRNLVQLKQISDPIRVIRQAGAAAAAAAE